MKKVNSNPVQLTLHTATTKQTWTWFMVMDGAKYFHGVWGKPIAPTLKRWRRLRRLLMQEERND
ncbi:hypothetical protein [Lacticaseibacillus sharpeae]|uniref:Uncharacterized protein n=1 Tax=Lacticaseibacillus sharpeae JCM 1186 = DSM 20505 TaxID=1291052 RepID=A0A0R1ZKD6_9LACO|nr:hypothetical protein [Lacticaseibacillus sharpeae]KRM54802.1 hypothetical protein FC18_GL002219 [Lacticaseibacillus sharpeae JCM 1186 = DSM 20505]